MASIRRRGHWYIGFGSVVDGFKELYDHEGPNRWHDLAAEPGLSDGFAGRADPTPQDERDGSFAQVILDDRCDNLC